MTILEFTILGFNVFPLLIILFKEWKQEEELNIVKDQLNTINVKLKIIQEDVNDIQKRGCNLTKQTRN